MDWVWRCEASAKSCVAVVLAIGVSFRMGWDRPRWAVLKVLEISQATVALAVDSDVLSIETSVRSGGVHGRLGRTSSGAGPAEASRDEAVSSRLPQR